MMRRWAIVTGAVLVMLVMYYVRLLATGPTTLLIQQSDISDLGGFIADASYLGLSGNSFGVAFNAANNSLYVGAIGDNNPGNGVVDGDMVQEIDIPASNQWTTTINSMVTASQRQAYADPTENHQDNICDDAMGNALSCWSLYAPGPYPSIFRSNYFVYNNKLIGQTYFYYDAGLTAKRGFFTRSLNLSTPSFAGHFKVGSANTNIGGEDFSNPAKYIGYMGTVPAEWNSGYFGKPAFIGGCCHAIISRSSEGPAIALFDPDRLGLDDPVAATVVLGYPDANDPSHDRNTVGKWYACGDYHDGAGNFLYTVSTNCIVSSAMGATPFMGTPNLRCRDHLGNTMPDPPCNNFNYSQASTCQGAAMINGTATLLVFCTIGVGAPCYGNGGSMNPGGPERWCSDPVATAHGTHAYPYTNRVLAYDLNCLLHVKNGDINPDTSAAWRPWECYPYANWDLGWQQRNTFDSEAVGIGIAGVGYDSTNQYLYVAQVDAAVLKTGWNAFNRSPIIHVLKVNIPSSNVPRTKFKRWRLRVGLGEFFTWG